MTIRVLIAAEARLAVELARALPRPEFSVEVALESCEGLLERAKELRPQLVLLQLGLARRDGNRCVQDLMAFAPTPTLF